VGPPIPANLPTLKGEPGPRVKYFFVTAVTLRIAYWGMAETVPRFKPKMVKSGRWFVSVVTGNGPDSHIGDFETEAAAKNWILTKSRYWPSKPVAPK
jgi:hypothetical protein